MIYSTVFSIKTLNSQSFNDHRKKFKTFLLDWAEDDFQVEFVEFSEHVDLDGKNKGIGQANFKISALTSECIWGKINELIRFDFTSFEINIFSVTLDSEGGFPTNLLYHDIIRRSDYLNIYPEPLLSLNVEDLLPEPYLAKKYGEMRIIELVQALPNINSIIERDFIKYALVKLGLCLESKLNLPPDIPWPKNNATKPSFYEYSINELSELGWSEKEIAVLENLKIQKIEDLLSVRENQEQKLQGLNKHIVAKALALLNGFNH